MAHQPHQWHPAPPQYGASPFQYPQQAQPPSQQQFQYNPSAPSPSIRQQYPYPPPLNQSRFDANSQIPSPNSIPPQYSSAGFNPALFHQFGNSTLLPPPPPSFPPIPLPNGTFPPFIQPPQLSNNFQNQYSPHGQATQASIPPQHYRTVEQPSYHMEQRNMPQIELQKGMDMSDREMADTRTNAPTMATEPFRHNNNSTHNGVLQRQKVDIAVAAPSDRTDSVSSYNPPSASPPESGEAPADSSNGVQAANFPAGEITKYQGRGAFEMRELAKGALLSLAPHNIKFSDLLAEGIDAQLLSQLFDEVGLKTMPNATSKLNPTNGYLPVEPSPAQTMASKPSPATNLASDARPSVGVSDLAVRTESSALPAGTAVQPQASTPGNTALAAAKTADSQPSASPTMERKDVIAAMLAAKMGKPIPRKESPGVTALGLPAKSAPVPLTSTSNTIESPPQSTQPTVPNSSSQSVADDPANKLTPKPRSIAKTELVLQKMEQLKRETAAKAHTTEASQEFHSVSQSPSVSRSTSGLANGLSTYSQASLPPKPVSQEVVMENTQMPSGASSMVVQSVSGFAPPSSAMFTSSIPGLFMMDADRDPVSVPSREEGVSVANLDTHDTNGLGPDMSSNTTYGAKLQQRIALDLGTVSREVSSSRIPSKRPLAVDAFDEVDLPPAKSQGNRPISSREHDSVASDRYSDDISEGEIMEIDEGSPVSPLPRAAGYRLFLNSSDAGAAWPTVSSHASPSLQRRDTADGLGSTEASYRPGFNGPRALAPSKHDLELETMKKKLAEAEERRKAKQIAPRLHSPASSSMNKPLIPALPSPVALSTVNAVPMNGRRRQQSPQLNSAVQVTNPPFSNTSELKSPKPSAPIDSVQRAKELREKLLRQRMLKQGLPELDKEVQKTQNRQAEAQARLAQLRREAEKREEEAREARKREQEILEEVKRLEEQLEMGMNGQQQFSHEMETLDQEMAPQVAQSAELESDSQPVINEAPSTVTTIAEVVSGDTTFDAAVDDVNELTPERGNLPESGDSVSNSEDEPVRQDYSNRLVRPSAEAALPTAEEETAFLEPAMMDESVSDEEAPASPDNSDHHDEADVSPRDKDMSDSDDSPMEVDSDTDGSASMSDSGSEDYQPADPITSTIDLEPADDEDEEYDPMDAPVSGTQPLLLEEDQEDYEPSEVVETLEVQTTPPATGSPVSNGAASENEPEHGDDGEHGLELTEANTLTNPQELLPSVPDTADTADTNTVPRASEPITSHFTPYQSALSNFKSYRFNRQFTDRVPHGYRSLTYSNIIDPAKPLCPTEAQGEMCNDVDCEEQHFKQMSLADEKILVQMSSASDMPDKMARDRFLAGLKLVIADLSAKQISDFDIVASELAAYRRRFRQEQDPSLAFTPDENEL